MHPDISTSQAYGRRGLMSRQGSRQYLEDEKWKMRLRIRAGVSKPDDPHCWLHSKTMASCRTHGDAATSTRSPPVRSNSFEGIDLEWPGRIEPFNR